MQSLLHRILCLMSLHRWTTSICCRHIDRVIVRLSGGFFGLYVVVLVFVYFCHVFYVFVCFFFCCCVFFGVCFVVCVWVCVLGFKWLCVSFIMFDSSCMSLCMGVYVVVWVCEYL